MKHQIELASSDVALILRALTTHKEHGGMLITRREMERVDEMRDRLWKKIRGDVQERGEDDTG